MSALREGDTDIDGRGAQGDVRGDGRLSEMCYIFDCNSNITFAMGTSVRDAFGSCVAYPSVIDIVLPAAAIILLILLAWLVWKASRMVE